MIYCTIYGIRKIWKSSVRSLNLKSKSCQSQISRWAFLIHFQDAYGHLARVCNCVICSAVSHRNGLRDLFYRVELTSITDIRSTLSTFLLQSKLYSNLILRLHPLLHSSLFRFLTNSSLSKTYKIYLVLAKCMLLRLPSLFSCKQIWQARKGTGLQPSGLEMVWT